MIGKSVDEAAALLTKGELVAIPTETVYGLSANALNPIAVAKIFKAKKRPSFNPLIIHVPSIEMARHYVEEIPKKIEAFLQEQWPAPITVLLPKKEIVPDIVTAGLDTVAVRVPNHPVSLALLQQLDFPLAAPSANIFGYVSPTTAIHVEDSLGESVSYILDGGPANVGIESTIISYRNGITVHRLGGMKTEVLEDYFGEVHYDTIQNSNPSSPGQMDQHYSPNIKTRLLTDDEVIDSGKKNGLLCFKESKDNRFDVVKALSQKGDFEEAAAHLFEYLRWFETQDVDVLYLSLLPNEGLGKAINDRLYRASS